MAKTNGGQGRSGGSTTQYCYSVEAGSTRCCEGVGFIDMFGDRCPSPGTCDDLFDLVWKADGRCSSSMHVQHPAGGRPSPPSEDEMAAWLYPIVRGEEPRVVAGLPHQDDDNHHPSDPAGHAVMVLDDQQAAPTGEGDKPPRTEHKCCAEDPTNYSREGIRKKASSGGARRSHHAETRNLTEKRRRCKINERFKTLQQLVPGCDDKSNQASTLDQTIQYMKELKQQIEAISFGCGAMKPAGAVYPVVPPPYLPPAAIAPGVVLAPPPAMVPFSPIMLPPGHHPAVMVHPMLYPAVAYVQGQQHPTKGGINQLPEGLLKSSREDFSRM
ncbi:hypothetical protein BS78_08G132700 [Paspalum vaginatum]|nr:hypothetical protein BS78_08G132700 [Paspalum vaginatum]